MICQKKNRNTSLFTSTALEMQIFNAAEVHYVMVGRALSISHRQHLVLFKTYFLLFTLHISSPGLLSAGSRVKDEKLVVAFSLFGDASLCFFLVVDCII